MRRYPLKLIFAAAILIFFVAGEAYYLYISRGTEVPDPPRLQSKYFKREKAEWAETIDTLGAKAAYQKFVEVYGKLPPGSAHSLAHVFGELLYEKEGLPGVAVCDSSFGFGCYHSFFGRAISEHGVEVLGQLDRACVAAWGEKGLGCSHGIGHGLLWSVGDDKLAEALDICATLTWKGPIGGCSGGVFMEYNFHTMADPDLTSPRMFDPKKAHAPCDALSIYREACYFDMPQWWMRTFNGDAAPAAALCAEVGAKGEREACFKGIGNIVAPESGYDVKKSLAVCNSLVGTEEQLLCRQGASWSFFAEPRVRDLSPQLCAGLSEDARQSCVAGSQIIR
ncbi:hypothetical protein K8Q93_03750 [Candidatus Parcubacteria bacterium]|nr:hypothetical protein [Candidatus Parcubacteria bacterium]